MTIQEHISKLKESQNQLVDSILAEESLSIYEKLSIIRNNNLWGYDNWIQRIFEKQQKQFRTLIAETGEKIIIIDDFINSKDYLNRKETIDLVDELLFLSENEEVYESGEVVVLTNRGTDHEFKMKIQDVEKAIYDWCVENKKLGYKFDW